MNNSDRYNVPHSIGAMEGPRPPWTRSSCFHTGQLITELPLPHPHPLELLDSVKGNRYLYPGPAPWLLMGGNHLYLCHVIVEAPIFRFGVRKIKNKTTKKPKMNHLWVKWVKYSLTVKSFVRIISSFNFFFFQWTSLHNSYNHTELRNSTLAPKRLSNLRLRENQTKKGGRFNLLNDKG